MKRMFVPLLLLSACAAPGPWQLETFPGGIEGGPSSRLTFQEGQQPYELELLHLDTGVEAFLNLKQGRFSQDHLLVHLIFPEFDIEESLPLRRGNTRIRLSQTATEELIATFRKGESVLIEVEGEPQLVTSDTFDRLYKKWVQPDTHLFETKIR